MSQPENIFIPSTDGYQLSASLYRSDTPKGVIQTNSATGTKKEFYHHFASHLQSQHFHVITFDYRGIGGSRPATLKGFNAMNHDWGQKDMTAVLDWADASFPHLKKFVIGHSAGGQQLGLMSNYHKISKAFFVGCSIGYWPYLTAPYRYFAAFAFYFIFPASIFSFGYVASNKFGLGEDLPKGVAEEWRSWCRRPNYFGDFLDNDISPTFYRQISFPIHSVHLEDDSIANTKTVNALLEFYPNADKTIEKVLLKEVNARKVGHFGFFSRSMKDKLWLKAVDFFSA